MSTPINEVNYFLRKTDLNELPFIVNRLTTVSDEIDLTLVGKRLREYGEAFNTNMIRLLENFACPAVNPEGNIVNQIPDTSNTSTGDLLTRPVEGQLWYNSSSKKIYYYKIIDIFENTGQWVPLTSADEVAGNYGQLQSGEPIPRPEIMGYTFPYEECTWIVSPLSHPEEITEMECDTEENYIGSIIDSVTAYCRFKIVGQETWTYAPVNYQIIGIRENL